MCDKTMETQQGIRLFNFYWLVVGFLLLLEIPAFVSSVHCKRCHQRALGAGLITHLTQSVWAHEALL